MLKEYENKKLKKQVKGITLIALVITIIIMLILASIAINLSIGNNGLITRAKQAKEQTQNAIMKEGEALQSFGEEINKIRNPVVEETYTVTYTACFPDQKFENIKYGEKTPELKFIDGHTEIIDGKVVPKREGYIFMGWALLMEETVTGNVIYVATWTIPQDTDIN